MAPRYRRSRCAAATATGGAATVRGSCASASPPGPSSSGTAPAPSSPMPSSTSTTGGSAGSGRPPRRRRPADAEVVALPGVLAPGLVNAHSHAPMVLFRGQGEGLPLDRWLQEVMWPREARLTAEDVEVAMTAASAEMLGNGVTTSVEMYFHPERIAAAVGRDRRARDHRHPAARRCRACRRSSEQLRGRGRAGRRRAATTARSSTASARTPPTRCRCRCSRDAAAAAREHGLLLHLHVAETATEGDDLLAAHGLSVPALLAAHDVLGGRVLAAHCVHMDDGDLELWREYDVAVAHCPASNAKLASGDRAAARHARPRHPGRAWAPTGRRPTTAWTCSPTCGWPPSWPGCASRTRPR